MWKNLVPDFFPIDKQGVMNDLIVLHLSSHPNMQYLIDTKDHDPSMSALCNLAELHLSEMDIEDLCRGPLPSGFLEQLEILMLTGCYELKSILFNANYNLCHLQSIELDNCPKLMSVFQPSTASSLKELEELTIKNCRALEYIIAGEDGDNNQKSYYDSLFPSLKELKLSGVPSFIGIVKGNHQLVSSSTHKQLPPLSRHNSRNLNQSLATRAFSWVQACYSLNTLRPASKETNMTIFEDRPLDHTNQLGLLASKWIDTAPTIVRQLVLQVRHTRKMDLAGLSLNSVSKLFTFSMASIISWEELKITKFDGLKHLVTSEDDDYKEQISCHSIFPKLKNLEIRECKDLKFLFLSSISIEIKNLKSLTIGNAPKLTYVVGKYQHLHCISNQNQNDELHFDLPALEALSFEDVPEIITIGPKYFIMESLSLQNVCSYEGQLNSNTTKKFDTSIDRGAPSLTAQSLLLQPLKNVRKVTLLECHNVITLSTLSIAASTIALETLTILRCHKLKCITTHEEDAQVDRNNCSIFPTLGKLEIKDCKELEFLFVSAISVGLQKLKSLTIDEVPKLKCVFGNYQKEQHSSNHNQNDELHFDLPALETLYINYAPKINIIFAKNDSIVNWIATEEVHASTIGAALFHVTQNLLKNIREIELVDCTNLISLTTLSIASITLLEVLKVGACGQLKYIVGDEGDARTQINYNSIFPKLKRLEVWNCNALEYLFPAFAFRFPIYLESLKIRVAPMLNYVFGRSQHDDSLNLENQNIQTLIDFPALKDLSLEYVPKLVSIYPKNYYMRGLYLRSVILKELPEFTMRHFNEFLVCWHTEQQETKVIEMCWKTLEYLQYLFSIKISDILPKLLHLEISNAYELEHVLIKQDEMKEMFMKNVLPQLEDLTLSNLHNLISVCHGINFQQEDYFTEVYNCPNFDTSTTQHQADLETGNSQVEEKTEERLSSHMVEEITQQSFNKVVEARAKGVSSNTLYQTSLTSKKEVPIHTSLSLIALPTRDNTPACAKIFEEEEEEQGCLITSQRLQSGMKASSSLLEDKLETSIDGDPFAPPVITILSEQTSQAILSSKASTSLNQAPSTLSKSSNDNDVQVYHKSHSHSTNLFEGVNDGDMKEAGMVQNEYKSNVESSSLTQREQESSYSKGQIQTKDQLTDSQPRSIMPTTPLVTISQDEYSEEPIPMSLNSTFLSRSQSTTVKIFEEEERGGLITTPRHESDMKAVSSLPPRKEHKTSNQGDSFVPPMPVISSEQQASDTILPLSVVLSKAITSPKRISISTYGGRNVQENVGTTNNQPLHETLDAIQISSQLAEYGSSEMASSICDIKNASSVVEVKEIVNMMKLEGVEPFMLAEVFNCDASEFHHKQQVLKSLGNKLEANKRELANVRNQEIKATQSIEMAQKELEAAKSHLNVAQQEYANIRVHHSKLLEECQEILEQRDQCSEIIAAKLRPFGF
ncbi:hypothetical protein K1719_017680 [Acacia pycnantha]|nr:hypothetical protein K1719_017680 [Acacia pycnantha]